MLVYADRRISPFEGSPRAGAAEYVLRGMFYKGSMSYLQGMISYSQNAIF